MSTRALTRQGDERPLTENGIAVVHKALAVLDIIAERGGSTAREIGDALGLPRPTVYRILAALVESDYLTHLKTDHRYELGYKLHALGVSLHRQVRVPDAVKREVAHLHETAKCAAYFAVYRGADVVVAYVVDSPAAPRLKPLQFGFHEAAHATAFGKIMLAGMTAEQRSRYLATHGLAPLTPATIDGVEALDAELELVSETGIAWEHEEFVPGQTCAAVGVRNGAGLIVGSVAISVATRALAGRERAVERELRTSGGRMSRFFRAGD